MYYMKLVHSGRDPTGTRDQVATAASRKGVTVSLSSPCSQRHVIARFVILARRSSSRFRQR